MEYPGISGLLYWPAAALVGLALIGFWSAARVRTCEEFYRGGGRLPAWAAGLSLVSGEIGAMTILGVAAAAYGENWRFLLFFAGSLFARLAVAALLLRPLYEGGSTTVYGYLRRRFSPSAQYISAGLFIPARLADASVRLVLLASVVSAMTQLSELSVIVLCATGAVLYIAWGGISAVVWAGVYQVTVVVAAGVVLLMFLASALDRGIGETLHIARAAGRLDLWGGPGFLWAICGSLFGSLAAFSTDQDLLIRLFSVKDLAGARKALIGSVFVALAVTILFLCIGTNLFVFYEQRPELAMPSRADEVLLFAAVQIFPGWLKGALLAAVVMASIDAPLLGLGAAFSEDLLRPLVRPNTTRTKFLKRARLSVAASGGLVALSAYFLQLNNSSIPVALKFYGAAMGPVMGLLILGVCTKWRLRRAGARIVALVGCLGAGCLIFFDGFFDGPQWYVYFISGAAAAVCAGAWSYRKFESAKDGR